ncbi:hypothetical protein HFP89_13575 [Wenzhouxiangella sp. XN79A]|uniref:hypothetical protein n=1 Tax=Wenzhouxiangella sp. XN79A TaxID=2724193 RepID=UPI00144AC25D|nr:hypothetical protein [Wenzhouxiangella sp. XN79A]NKI36195.1 hypothetical protein [Wenzhouxiangella sp. XN79A]
MTAHRRRRWPRLLLALTVALVVALTLLTPGLLGLLVHQRTEAWLAESWPDATVRWQRGWFSSRLEAADGRTHLVLRLAHPPTDLAGPLAADGTLTLAAPQGRIALDATLHWPLHLGLDAEAARLQQADTGVGWTAERPTLALFRRRHGAVDLQLGAAELSLTGPPDARLSVRDPSLRVTDDGADPGRLSIDLDARRPGQPASRLRVAADGIDRERAGAVIEAVSAALATRPGSAGASIAWLGVASAWEQLARAGLSLTVDPLALDGEARIEGRWQPAAGAPAWTGGGRITAVEHWLVPILGLVRAEPAAQLRDELRLQFERAAERGALSLDGDRFSLTEPTGPSDPAR